MSEVLVEHPVLFIENLLKLGIGDEGRLLYLRNAITKGKNIHDSDMKFLKKMLYALNESNGLKSEPLFGNFKSEKFTSKNNSKLESDSKIFNREENNTSENTKNFTEIESGIQKIQNLITELKQSDSKLMDNLELLLISHDVSSSHTINNSNSFDSFSNLLKTKNTALFELLRKNFKSEKF